MAKKVLKKYSKAELETCGEKEHRHGCYLRLTNNPIHHTDDEIWTIIDFDKNNEIVGIEFVDGLPGKDENRKANN